MSARPANGFSRGEILAAKRGAEREKILAEAREQFDPDFPYAVPDGAGPDIPAAPTPIT